MEIKTVVDAIRMLWEVAKSLRRIETALLLLSGGCLAAVDAFWSWYGPQFSWEVLGFMAVATLFFGLAVVLAKRRKDPNAWRPFWVAAGLALLAVFFAGSAAPWLFLGANGVAAFVVHPK